MTEVGDKCKFGVGKIIPALLFIVCTYFILIKAMNI
jgi:hypothetical protein